MTPSQPTLPGNDWWGLEVPRLGAWRPVRSVSVVIPTYRPAQLAHVLAALAAQTYPASLLEVVVVDDGSETPVVLPALRPENCWVVRAEDGWGPSAARHTGAMRSSGEILHWLDDDMVVDHREVEAQARWHHLIDYAVVLGYKQFAAADALAHLTPHQLHERLVAGAAPAELASGTLTEHTWIEKILADTDDLRAAGPRAMRVHTTATASCTRALYLDSGGFPPGLVKGEDTVLGYRLREAGAIFVPDREALSLHVGEPTVHRDADAMNRFNKPFLTDLVPEFRGHRTAAPRSYQVPYVEIVVPVADSTYEEVRRCVDHQLSSTVPDLVVTLRGPWDLLNTGRRQVLTDPTQDLHLLRAAYGSEPRVRFAAAAAMICEATFRLSLSGAGWFPVGAVLEGLLRIAERDHLGGFTITAGDGSIAHLERSAALRRSRRITPDATADLAGELYPIRTLTVTEAGLIEASTAPDVPHIVGLGPWQLPQKREQRPRRRES